MATKYTFLFGILFSLASFAQDGTLDLSFGNDGYVVTNITNNNDVIYQVKETINSNLLVIGNVDESTNAVTVISKYLSNGEVDLSFGNDGIVYPSYNTAPFGKRELIVLPDNSFYVLGSENEDFLIAKHLTNGDIDNTFGVNGITTTDFDADYFQTAILQEDGKLLAIGRTDDVTNYYQIMMVRYLPNGDLDPTFGSNGIALYDTDGEFFRTRKILLQNDGKILLQQAEYSNTPKKLIIYRFMPNGTIDNSFGDNGKVIVMGDTSLTGGSMVLKPDGKIIATASNIDIGLTKIIQYLPDGTVDFTFADNGEKIINLANFYTLEVFFQGNRLLIYGHISEFEGTTLALARFTENGNIDTTFGSNGYSYNPYFQNYNVIIQSDDKIVVAGSTYWYEGETDFVLARYKNNFLETNTPLLNKLTVYPNPSNGIFNISHNFITSETPYQISDITGKIIQQGNITGEQSQIDISQSQNGVYLFTSEGTTVRLLKN
ncbi:MAG: T9SS type A sorting domain-containing protein [Flavobacteriaceae bacterium]|nr:T9SS type A sorting domain-containing protein [Flavobacteriaceae bacterium]